MRPSDENQASSHPHLRPNLMSSSRRGGHDDSILAKLEREPARRAGGRTGRRLAWYGASALVAVALTATLAWLAAGSGDQVLEVAQATESNTSGAAGTVTQPLQEAQPTTEEVLGLPPEQEAKSALIVDSAPDAAPPLRMLDAPAARPTPAPAPPVAAPPAPVRVAAAPVPAKRPEPRPEPRPERRAEPRAEPRAAARLEARPSAARPRSASARPPARPSSRSARTINPARTGEHDDSDVALISAVIYHANGHASADGNDENTSNCGDEPCRARPARQ